MHVFPLHASTHHVTAGFCSQRNAMHSHVYALVAASPWRSMLTEVTHPETPSRPEHADAELVMQPCLHAELLETKHKAWYLKLTFWEKFYYLAGVTGAGLFVYSKVDWDGSKAAAAEVCLPICVCANHQGVLAGPRTRFPFTYHALCACATACSACCLLLKLPTEVVQGRSASMPSVPPTHRSNLVWWPAALLCTQAQRKKDEETRAKRLEALPLYLNGNKNFADEEETLFEGASPVEINALEAAYWESKGGKQKATNRWSVHLANLEDDPYEVSASHF